MAMAVSLAECSLVKASMSRLSSNESRVCGIVTATLPQSLGFSTLHLKTAESGKIQKREYSFVCLCTAQPVTEVAQEEEAVPLPVVVIDQHTEPDATVLDLQFGDRLGALLDTAKALTDLGLNVVRAQVSTTDSVGRNRFVITRSDTGQKVEDPDMLEAIRLTVIGNLLQYHPESSERLALAAIKGSKPPKKDIGEISTIVRVDAIPGDNARSVLTIETADRPGLIMDMVKVLVDMSVAVESAEIDTEGLVAKDQFYVSYHGEPLNASMREVVVNTLRYYLTKPEIESEDSY